MKKKLMIQACVFILSGILGVILGTYLIGESMLKRLDKLQSISNKHLALFKLSVQWVKIKQQDKNVSDFLKEEGYKNIGIYGMGYLGERLIDELKNTGINVLYGIDRNANLISSSVDVVSVNDNFKTVDVIVVTAITFFDEIYRELSKKIDCPIISLEDIIYIL